MSQPAMVWLTTNSLGGTQAVDEPDPRVFLGDELMPLVELKELIVEHSLDSSSLGQLILAEPDLLPRREVIAKLEIYVRLLYKEIRPRLRARWLTSCR